MVSTVERFSCIPFAQLPIPSCSFHSQLPTPLPVAHSIPSCPFHSQVLIPFPVAHSIPSCPSQFPVVHSIPICSPWNVFHPSLPVLDHEVLVGGGRVAVKKLDMLLEEVHLHTHNREQRHSTQTQSIIEPFLSEYTQ